MDNSTVTKWKKHIIPLTDSEISLHVLEEITPAFSEWTDVVYPVRSLQNMKSFDLIEEDECDFGDSNPELWISGCYAVLKAFSVTVAKRKLLTANWQQTADCLKGRVSSSSETLKSGSHSHIFCSAFPYGSVFRALVTQWLRIVGRNWILNRWKQKQSVWQGGFVWRRLNSAAVHNGNMHL